MSLSQTNKEAKLANWNEIIKDQKASGKRVPEYCRDNNISKHAYYYWHKKVKDAARANMPKLEEPVSLKPKQWMKLDTEEKACDYLIVEVSGCCIKVDKNTNQDLLLKVCSNLRAMK